MVWLFNRSLVGGVRYVTCIPSFWRDDVSMTSPALLNDCYQLVFLCCYIIAGNLELIIAKQIWQFGALLLLNKRLKFGDYELLNNRWQFGYVLLLNACWRFGDSLSLKLCWQFLATSYHLNRNDRVSRFYWTRGSKLCFLTCFSYFSCYFLILVFL